MTHDSCKLSVQEREATFIYLHVLHCGCKEKEDPENDDQRPQSQKQRPLNRVHRHQNTKAKNPKHEKEGP